ncbi:MAG: selenocysteine-specific translation elongation factor [candidate division Zixibacteria bacterium]|nr:selenocysteine-specific translation elongation factor [candidate division Zixibacteria bacterium]
MITIGTAGHIDHGKSRIVLRLTGTDPDRLPEEKERGMTIDLGFAFYRTPDGESVALVDVPGHERFVKNMIAGAGGIEAVMLVVAADDGWMPQSQEHFQVVRLLGVQQGFIVINKIDLAESDWLELLEQDIRDKVRGSFLENAPIFRVSAATGAGIDELRQFLNELPGRIGARGDINKARLYIDRSFVRPGIGGVVTGTLRGGNLSLGQTVAVWPSEKVGKIRSLQSNNQDVQLAQPGQRTAVSITGVDKEYLQRGGVISDRLDLSYFREHPVMALSIEMISEAPVALTEGREILLITGTTEVSGTVRLFRDKNLKPGQKGIVFFRPEAPLYALVGDHFVARLPTPMVTLGGGCILDHLANFPRRRHFDSYAYLEQRASALLDDLVVSELRKAVIRPHGDFLGQAAYSDDDIHRSVARLERDGIIGIFGKYIIHRDGIGQAVRGLTAAIDKFLSGKPHLRSLSFMEIGRLSPYSDDTTRVLVEYMVSQGNMVVIGDRYNLAGRGAALQGAIKQAHDEIMAELKANPFTPPTLGGLAGRGKNYKEAIKYILDQREGCKCGSDFIFLSEAWDKIVAFIRQRLDSKGELMVTELRDQFAFSRKFVIPILEETDRIKLTRREGDKRVKGEKYEG